MLGAGDCPVKRIPNLRCGCRVYVLGDEMGERGCLGAISVHGVLVFFQAEDGIRDIGVTGVQTCALPISQFFENSLYESGMVREVIEELRSRGLAYDQEGAVWFKASALGGEKDKVIVKSTGDRKSVV